MFPEIDYNLLGMAKKFYQEKGYEYIEVPWMVEPSILHITTDIKYFDYPTFQKKALVGSAEQSFIQLMLDGKLDEKGLYQSITPCFRDEDKDKYHFPYFMKLELFAYDNDKDFFKLCKDALEFHQNVVRLLDINKIIDIKRINTSQFDLEIKGIEIGSYGERDYEGHIWCYGTGLALPRFTQVLEN